MSGVVWVVLCCVVLIVSHDSVFVDDFSISQSIEDGAVISRVGYDVSDGSWISATVPTTAIGALLENNIYKDVFYGKNLERIDGRIFDTSWWFRSQFEIRRDDRHHDYLLRFKGINYRANLYFNGVKIMDQRDFVGTFRYFDILLPHDHIEEGENVIALEIFKPINDAFPPGNNDTDLSISFIDWAPVPVDNSMGIWRDVQLIKFNNVLIDYPIVITKLEGSQAFLTVVIEATNHVRHPIRGIVEVTMFEGDDQFTLRQEVFLSQETQKIVFDYQKYSQLTIENPDLWWPWQMGEQTLHNIHAEFKLEHHHRADQIDALFGIREVTDLLDLNGHRLYKINGKNILIRGAGWSPDMFLRNNRTYTKNEFEYMRNLNMNTVRLEGKMPDDYFFELADQYGILVMAGWACCDAWQHWSVWDEHVQLIARESLRSQIRRLAIHPSTFVFLYASDEYPPANIEQQFLNIFTEEKWPNAILASASERTSTITGPSGVKMSGPYAWVPPNYWSSDKLGGAFGFLTEGGPGSSPLIFDSFKKVIPVEQHWPINDYWDFHCANPKGLFRNLRFFTPPLTQRYGESTSAEQYLCKAQATTYEAQRAMFEGYSRNKYISTGVIQWMLNNAWPEMVWNLYDYYLNQGGGYFGAKKGNSPVHVQYTYADSTIWLVNSLYQNFTDLTMNVTVYDIKAQVLYQSKHVINDIPSDSSNYLFTLPDVKNLSPTWFLRLSLSNNTDNSIIDVNTYWVSTQKDVLDWNNSTFYITYCTQYADFSLLEALSPVKLTVKKDCTADNGKTTCSVTVSNPTTTISFFTRIRIISIDTRNDILPILWSDNYITLFPGEQRILTASFDQTTNFLAIAEPYNNCK